MSRPVEAREHTHPEEGGLVLCPTCGPDQRPLTAEEMAGWWTDTISLDNPRYCDACGQAVVPADMLEVRS